MNNSDFEGESEDRWEVAWSEFDWERYVRQQDDSIRRYLAFYDDAKPGPERIDEAARQMGWEFSAGEDDGSEFDGPAEEGEEIAGEAVPFTLHKHPVYVATKALYLSLQRSWETLVVDFHQQIPATTQIGLLSSLHRGELQAVMAIQSLDVGDYPLSVSQFKRALVELNEALRHVDDLQHQKARTLLNFRADARARLFDLREIWLRVMADCRAEENSMPEEGEAD